MQLIERTIISHFIASALDAGFFVRAVSDGEERHTMKPTHAGTIAEVLNIVDSVDDSSINFRRTANPEAKGETLRIILGNGSDCLSDMSCGRADWDDLVAVEARWAEGDVLAELVDAQALQIETLQAQLAIFRTAAADGIARAQELADKYDKLQAVAGDSVIKLHDEVQRLRAEVAGLRAANEQLLVYRRAGY